MHGLVVTCVDILMVGIFLATVFYLRSLGRIIQKTWDMTMVTAGDFTVKMNISEAAFEEFKKKWAREGQSVDESLVYNFKL